MPAERYFMEGEITQNTLLILEGQEFHHLFHVMRAKNNDKIEIINGKGILAQAVVEEIKKKRAFIKIVSIASGEQNSFKIILAQALPRMNRLDFIVEKGTELGMNELWLFPGVLSEKKDISEHQLDRLKNLSIAAIKQSGRLWLPKIELKRPLLDWKKVDYPAFFGDVGPHANYFIHLLKKTNSLDSLIFFTGPESGFHEQEIHKLQQMSVQGVKLHDNILRTDTASIMALSTLTTFLQV